MYKSPWFTCKAKWTYSSGIRTTPLRQPDAFLFKAGPRNHLSDMHLIIAIIIMQLPLYKVYDAIWYEGMFVFFFLFFFLLLSDVHASSFMFRGITEIAEWRTDLEKSLKNGMHVSLQPLV